MANITISLELNWDVSIDLRLCGMTDLRDVRAILPCERFDLVDPCHDTEAGNLFDNSLGTDASKIVLHEGFEHGGYPFKTILADGGFDQDQLPICQGVKVKQGLCLLLFQLADLFLREINEEGCPLLEVWDTVTFFDLLLCSEVFHDSLSYVSPMADCYVTAMLQFNAMYHNLTIRKVSWYPFTL